MRKFYTATAAMQEYTANELAYKAGISHMTARSALLGGRVQQGTAEKIVAGLGIDMEVLFIEAN